MSNNIAHAKLSASGSGRWLTCPASVRLEESFPDQSSKFANEGTVAHYLAELCLIHDCDAHEIVEGSLEYAHQKWVKFIDSYSLDELEFLQTGQPEYEDNRREMGRYVQGHLDYVNSFSGKLFTEKRVDFSTWVPDGFGTSDVTIINNKTVRVIDLKYGKGVQVYAENNSQLMLYALGVYNEFGFLYDIEEFIVTVSQPRLDHIDEWTISKDDLLFWAENELKPKAELAASGKGGFNPGESQCRFCKAKKTCKALAEQIYETACEGFETFDSQPKLKNVESLSIEEKGSILNYISLLKNWAGAIEDDAIAYMLDGGQIPGWKLVEGRSNRKWIDEEAAGKALSRKLTKREAYTSKIISPTVAEKKLGKGDSLLKKHAHKPEGKPTLAPENDKRPSLAEKAAEGFEIAEAA